MEFRVVDLILFKTLKDLSTEELVTGMQDITDPSLSNSAKQESNSLSERKAIISCGYFPTMSLVA